MELNTPLTLGSLFDGSGGFPLGGLLAGIKPVWASEIEPFPIRVTTKQLPFMKHYGDVSTMNGAEIEPVDIITFGSPCQDMSIAGRRSGLDGSRSSLFYEAIRIIKEMRNATDGKYPRYIVWENVPGAFSSNGGEDFKAVLEAVIGIVESNAEVPMPNQAKWPYADCYLGDGWSVAYRTLDAQYWGVPQRRRRIYLVADFAGRCAADILFKSEGLSGYSAESFRAWQSTTRGTAPCVGATGCDGYNGELTGEVSATLGVNCGMSTGRNGVVLNDQGGSRMDITTDVTNTLRSQAHHPPCVLDAVMVALEHHPIDSRIKMTEDNTVQTLTSRMGTGGNNVPLVMKLRSGCEGGGKGALIQENKSATLACNNDQTLFEPKAYGICSKGSNAMLSENPNSGFYEADTSRTLDGNGGNPTCNQGGIAVVAFAQNQRDEVRDLGDHSASVCANAGMKQQTYVLQGSMIGRKDENGPQGDGINEEVSFTLNTADRHAVYAVTTGSFTQVAEDKAPTVLARDYKDAAAVCYGIGRDTFNHGKNAKFSPTFNEGLQPTLVAKGPGAIQCGYAVRRLTPIECARLQGFPDWWCENLETPEPTMDEIRWWYRVFETHRRVMDSSSKPKTLKQISKWLRNPYSDSAAYRMWGNGVALPCVYFVLSGIVYCTQKNAD